MKTARRKRELNPITAYLECALDFVKEHRNRWETTPPGKRPDVPNPIPFSFPETAQDAEGVQDFVLKNPWIAPNPRIDELYPLYVKALAAMRELRNLDPNSKPISEFDLLNKNVNWFLDHAPWSLGHRLGYISVANYESLQASTDSWIQSGLSDGLLRARTHNDFARQEWDKRLKAIERDAEGVRALAAILEEGEHHTPKADTEPLEPPQEEKPPPPPSIFDELRKLAKEIELKGKELMIVKTLCDRNGEIALTDLAQLMSWETPYEGTWNSARSRLNDKLKKYGWCFCTLNGKAMLKQVKKQRSKVVRKRALFDRE